jgi:hypothetical protein
MPAGPELCLNAVAPDRTALIGGGDGLFTDDGLADRGARDAPTRVVWRRGGRLPPAAGSPAAMRATRALLRRRQRMRQRAKLVAPLPKPHSPDHRPAIGQQIASPVNRVGVAARWPSAEASAGCAPTRWRVSAAERPDVCLGPWCRRGQLAGRTPPCRSPAVAVPACLGGRGPGRALAGGVPGAHAPRACTPLGWHRPHPRADCRRAGPSPDRVGPAVPSPPRAAALAGRSRAWPPSRSPRGSRRSRAVPAPAHSGRLEPGPAGRSQARAAWSGSGRPSQHPPRRTVPTASPAAWRGRPACWAARPQPRLSPVSSAPR